jgi:hypothetical protein
MDSTTATALHGEDMGTMHFLPKRMIFSNSTHRILNICFTIFPLRHIFDPHLSDKLPEIINLLQDIDSRQTALEILELLLRYVVIGTKRYTEKIY